MKMGSNAKHLTISPMKNGVLVKHTDDYARDTVGDTYVFNCSRELIDHILVNLLDPTAEEFDELV